MEKHLERIFYRRVAAAGGWAIKLVSPAQAGVPDRGAFLPGGRLVLVELKAPTGRVSPIQAKVHARLRSLGFDVRVIRTNDEISAMLSESA